MQDHIIGHEKNIKILKKILLGGNLQHAYLFYGPDHIGKSLIAFKFAQAILCPKNEDRFKNICSICKNVRNNNYPDFFYLPNPYPSKLKIETVRTLRKSLGLKSYQASHQVVLIENMENFTIEAANAFLKILEEPHKGVIFIITTSNLNSLPSTIISRCQVINFQPPPISLIERALIKRGLEKEKAGILSQISSGLPGLAIRFTEKPEIFSSYKELFKKFIDILSYSDFKKLLFVHDLINKEQSDDFLKIITIALRNFLLIKIKSCFAASIIEEKLLKKIFKKLSIKQILQLLEQTKKIQFLLAKTNINKKMALEILLLNFPRI